MTSTQTQFRRGTEAQVNAMTPVAGEVVIDTTNNRACVGNGSTAGGIKVPTAKDIQSQYAVYGTVGGTANAITLTNAPAVTAYTNGLRLKFKATATNTGATTVNVDGLGVKNIFKMSSGTLGALVANDIYTGGIYELNYDGTQFQFGSGGGGGGIVAVKRQVFTSSGTYTPSAGMLYCDVELVGGGGGGGSAPSGGSDAGSGGGGAGGYARESITAATIGASQVVTIGAGGATGATGATGGTTSLGALLQATGGAGGARSAGGIDAGLGGLGGAGTGGDINIDGGDGDNGGGSSNDQGGTGGSSFFGGGGRGAETSIGRDGKAYGSGAGGGRVGQTGGTGKAGVVVITEYCSVA